MSARSRFTLHTSWRKCVFTLYISCLRLVEAMNPRTATIAGEQTIVHPSRDSQSAILGFLKTPVREIMLVRQGAYDVNRALKIWQRMPLRRDLTRWVLRSHRPYGSMKAGYSMTFTLSEVFVTLHLQKYAASSYDRPFMFLARCNNGPNPKSATRPNSS